MLRIGFYNKPLLDIWETENGNLSLPWWITMVMCLEVSYLRIMPFTEKWNAREIADPMCGNAESLALLYI